MERNLTFETFTVDTRNGREHLIESRSPRLIELSRQRIGFVLCHSLMLLLPLVLQTVVGAVNFQVVESTVSTTSLNNSLDDYTNTVWGSFGSDPCLAQTQISGHEELIRYGYFSDTEFGTLAVSYSIIWKIKWIGAGTPSGPYGYTGGWRSKSKACSSGHWEGEEAGLHSPSRTTLSDIVESTLPIGGRRIQWWGSADTTVSAGDESRESSLYFEWPNVDPDNDLDGEMDGMAAPFNDTNVDWSSANPFSSSTSFSQDKEGDWYAYIEFIDLNPNIQIDTAGESNLMIGTLSAWGDGALRKQYRLLTFGGETVSGW